MIRKATINDIDELLDVYSKAKKIMRDSGNLYQWDNNYPSKELLLNDIEKDQLYIIEEADIEASFVMALGDDPTYLYIEGKWLSDTPYVTIHRIAKRKGKGIFNKAIDFALLNHDHIRIDTHEDNIIMQKLITNYGFKYCGHIFLANGDMRLAYEYIK